MSKPAFERVNELLRYDPESGMFYWRQSCGNAVAGHFAGRFDKDAIRISVDGKEYRAHRLAWLLTYGEWPSKQVDHINRDHYDNRISNLRLATQGENIRNRVALKNNKSGFKGVYKSGNKWRSEITVNHKKLRLGLFDTPEEAHAAYCQAANKYHGEFANYG